MGVESIFDRTDPLILQPVATVRRACGTAFPILVRMNNHILSTIVQSP